MDTASSCDSSGRVSIKSQIDLSANALLFGYAVVSSKFSFEKARFATYQNFEANYPLLRYLHLYLLNNP